MFLKNKTISKEEVKARKPIVTIQDFLHTYAKYKGLSLENGISFPKKASSKAQKVTPMVQLAKPEEARSISEIFKQVYHNTYPYKEMENLQEIRKMIEDTDYNWILFKINGNEIIGCIGLQYDSSVRSMMLHGFAIKKEYQGMTSLPKLLLAGWVAILNKYEKKALMWFGEARSAHSKSQFLGAYLGLKPIAFFPKKDIFFNQEESQFLLILYDEEILTKYRKKETPKIILRVLPCYFYALKRYQLEFPEIKDHPTLDFDDKKIKTFKRNLIYQEEKDNLGNNLITISINNSDAYISFLHNPLIRIFEKTNYNILNKEQLFIFIEIVKDLIKKLEIRYFEFFASAYHPTHQAILYDAGLKAFGYIPCFKYIEEEDVFEDQIVFIYYEGKASGNLKMIPETENFLKAIKPSWNF